MAAETSSPAREPATSTRGRGRGGRGGRGRGRGGGRGTSNAAVSKSTAASRGRGGTRRGRVKNFSDSRVQAAYERQRDLKATYQAVAFALKPALQELAERSVDEMLQRPDSHKQAKEYQPIIQQLREKLDNKLRECDRRLECDLNLAEHSFNADRYVAEKEFQNALGDMIEQFYQGQENRLRILTALQAKSLPVDVEDDQYEYRVISDAELDNDFGIYECYKNGHLVPYPSRVAGTEMWRKARDPEASAATPRESSAAPTRGRGRGRAGPASGIKRRAVDQPDGQSTPKRSTRNVDDNQLLAPAPIAPAPMKGLLASAANVDEEPEGTPGEEESVPASPEPPLLNGNGSLSGRALSRQQAREKSPPLPKNIGEPDEYGVRTYNQRPSMREKGINSRILAPHVVWFEDWEIGFKDTSNDSSKGHTRAKRGKFLDTPNSNGFHFDHWCNAYDFSTTTPEDFDQELVKRYGVHPKYGIFLPNSTNDFEQPQPYVMPGKPIVYIANPSGRVSHASRGFQSTTNQRRSEESPLREKMRASLRRFCRMAEIDSDDIDIAEFVRSDDALRAKSLGTAEKEFSARPQLSETTSEADQGEPTPPQEPEQSDEGVADLSALAYAMAFIAAWDVTRAAAPPATTSKPARYDAIRDVFTDSKPDPAPAPESTGLGLNLLAELCDLESRPPGWDGHAERTGAVAESDLRTTIKHEEPPPVSSFSHAPMNPRLSQEPPPPYTHKQQSDRVTLPPVSSVHDRPAYPVPTPLDAGHRMDYKSSAQAPPAPPMPDHESYYPPPGGSYPPAPREPHISSGRPIEPGYNPRRLSYGPETPQQPAYSSTYWPRPPSSAGPPGPPSVLPPAGTSAPQPAPQGYPLHPPPSSSRMPFSQSASAEPLPPLRPPRARTQSMPEEPPYDLSMRGGIHSAYYPLHPRSYQRGYPLPEAHQPLPTLQPMPGERILSNPHQNNPPYMGSPPPAVGYASQIMSPTFANAPGLPGPLGQSPPGTPYGGPPGSIHRHRSTPSGSSDAGSNKYRKLQPAPVPPHRAWSNKPELKTIPYDHKETGSSAALPSSGPTQIRGWNVNQHRKRSKQDKGDLSNDRDESR
ncbi:uncharacterized protein MAM_01537 [Metarhizium album ARSEF 1941]|uniref:Sds3-like protein n=1 Tax=Metarhizium album (strain ARSEF 1941) TaxID=1081103 RepID=A0A0B2X370_METAS|nr:uncharacterized protein MAM_01537 [Metarhizium album ARSEF 1941]KHO00759.1 hypothetical protein MAM_01537 [Metarhizium album ARSEF 1941]